MTYFGCTHCLTVVRVVDEDELVERLIRSHAKWKDGRMCPSCAVGRFKEFRGSMRREARIMFDGNMFTSYELTAAEFFSALCGFGYPDEIDASPEVVSALLKSSSVKGVECALRDGRKNRTIVDRLDLSDGTSLHFTGSSVGAVVYKVTRRKAEGGQDVKRTE